MRQGRITASRAVDFMTKGRRSGDIFGETAKKYAYELALQRMGIDMSEITGYDITTWQMEWGIEYEADAREVYSTSRGISVDMPGFIPGDNMSGCTPDGTILNGDDMIIGLLEIKCPQWANHINYIMEGPERRYVYQMQFQMMITGAEWTDFMTYHPEFDGNLRARVHRIERDEKLISEMEARLRPFNELVQSIIDKLQDDE